MSSANSDSFPPSFPNWMPFFLPNFWALDFQYCVSKSGESEHPCLVPKLRGKAFSFSPLSMILTGTPRRQ